MKDIHYRKAKKSDIPCIQCYWCVKNNRAINNRYDCILWLTRRSVAKNNTCDEATKEKIVLP